MKQPKELNKSELVLIIVTCIIIFLSRLPFLSPGYGDDPDSYRIIIAARIIAETGVYQFSRPPGNPVYEYLTAITPAKSSAFFSNAVTAVFSCMAFIFFSLILRWFRIRYYLLIACAFALTPVVYVNSVCTMDYIPAIAFILGSTYFILIDRPLIAGIFLGLAIGTRMTSAFMFLPLSVWIFLEDSSSFKMKRFLTFIISAFALGAICFFPAINRFGFGFLKFSDYKSYPPLYELIETGILEIWGRISLLGFFCICCFVPFIFRSIKQSLKQVSVKKGMVLSLLVIILFIIAFLRLPLQSGYLLPAVPFSLLFLGLIIPPKHLKWLSILLCLSSFVMIGRYGISMKGPIINDHISRETQLNRVRKIIERVNSLNENAVIVADGQIPEIYIELEGESKYNISDETILTYKFPYYYQYIYSIPNINSYKEYIAQGRSVYFLNEVVKNYIELYQTNLKQLDENDVDTLNAK